MVVGAVLDHLRSHVEGGALGGHQHDGVLGHGACKAEVAQLDHTPRTQQHILGLQVPMHDVVAARTYFGSVIVAGMSHLRGKSHMGAASVICMCVRCLLPMQVVQGLDELLGNGLHHLLWQLGVLGQQLKQITCTQVPSSLGHVSWPLAVTSQRLVCMWGAPNAYSMTTQKSLFVSLASIISMMLGCWSFCMMLSSCLKATSSFSCLPTLLMYLIATTLPVNFLRALYTCAQGI